MVQHFHISSKNKESYSFEALRRFTRERKVIAAPAEKCELCGAPLMPEHRHLLNLSRHMPLCACYACAMLFNVETASARTYTLIPERYLSLHDFQMTDAQWDDLMLPVNVVYLVQSTEDKRVTAAYPGPAGATESLLDLGNWQALVDSNPVLRDVAPDVEALLINRLHGTREYYIVPIDACYQLVGRLRLSWHGLSGGEESRLALQEFFVMLRVKAGLPAIAGSSPSVKGAPDARPEL